MENPEIFSQAIEFRGHRNVLGLHRNTLEITMDQNISKRADCIIGVEATSGCSGLNPEIKKHIQAAGYLRVEIAVRELSYNFYGRGSLNLELLDPHEMVFRKSDFTSPRTVAVSCNAAAIDIPRKIIQSLQIPRNTGSLKIVALKDSENSELDSPKLEFLE